MTFGWLELKVIAELVVVMIANLIVLVLVVTSTRDFRRTGKLPFRGGEYDLKQDPVKCYLFVAFRILLLLIMTGITIYLGILAFCEVLKACS